MSDNKDQQAIEKNESNAERDQDEEGMNPGTIGGNMGITDRSNEQDKADYSRVSHQVGTSTARGDTGDAGNGSKWAKGEGSAAENI